MKIINIILPIFIAAGTFVLLLLNNIYNSRERVCDFSDARREGSSFYFDDIIVDIKPRGGDSGSWESMDLIDSNGDLIYKKTVGTIYEMTVANNSYNSIHN